MGPLRSKGSSVGEGGGAGSVRSISGISVLTVNTPVTLFRDFPDSGFGVALLVRDILGLELARRDWVGGLRTTTFGGVKTSGGGSYGGITGVALRRARRIDVLRSLDSSNDSFAIAKGGI